MPSYCSKGVKLLLSVISSKKVRSSVVADFLVAIDGVESGVNVVTVPNFLQQMFYRNLEVRYPFHPAVLTAFFSSASRLMELANSDSSALSSCAISAFVGLLC